MTVMKAAQVVNVHGVSEVIISEVPRPVPGKGEILIEVFAAGVTPTEIVWYPTAHNQDGTIRTRAIPGHEFSGVVARVGEGVECCAAGDEVFGMNDWFAEGATAEYCLTVSSSIARKRSISPTQRRLQFRSAR